MLLAARRRLAIWRTIEHFAANPLLPARTDRLCQATGVSGRTLRTVCQAHSGQSLIAYIRRCRMALAHGMLCRAGPEATVTEIATFCGFLDLGRFSVAYRRRYGQPPSQTMLRWPTRAARARTLPVIPARTVAYATSKPSRD